MMSTALNVENKRGQGGNIPCPRSGRLAVTTLALSLAMMAGCTSGENAEPVGPSAGSGNRPPVVKSAVIVPNPATLSGPLTVQADAQDLDLDNIMFRYRWSIN
ncbi:MAG: hypothetical protein OEY86_19815, partial [Nitrospira sp.]|nr:hypothetical protein [Nitrospira sp.]